MLILMRRNSEKVMIGEDIVVCVVESGENFVRLGFTAPAGVIIDREELYLSKKGYSAAAIREKRSLDKKARLMDHRDRDIKRAQDGRQQKAVGTCEQPAIPQ